MTEDDRKESDAGKRGSHSLKALEKLGFVVFGIFAFVIVLLGLVLVTLPVWGNVLLMGFPHG